MKVDPRWNDNTAPNISLPNGNEPFLLFPLIFSAGPDNKFDINTEGAERVSSGIVAQGGAALAVGVDVSDPVSAQAMVDRVLNGR